MAKIYKLLQLVDKGSSEKSFGTIVVELNKSIKPGSCRTRKGGRLLGGRILGVAGYQVNPSIGRCLRKRATLAAIN